MRQGGRVLTVVSTLLLFAAGCMTEPGLDKGKFAELNRAAQDLKTAIKAGGRCGFPDTLLQQLTSGTAALQDKTASKEERDLLAAYVHLLAVYQDGLFLCKSRPHLAGFPFVPKGSIYVTQELDPLVEKYDLDTEQHQYGPTGKYWRSISEDSITVIWESAEAVIQNIENMTKYN
jgi:hypothetical protein